MTNKYCVLSLVWLLVIQIVACNANDQVFETTNHQVNDVKAENAPSILLISIDGFRWDYVDKYQPKFLTQFAQHSARLKSLRPSFPTKTFPNHLTLVTGSYPQHHGIIANGFYAPDLGLNYSLRRSESVNNPQFYKRDPIWVIAEQQNMRTATFFWPGSEAAISDTLPTYLVRFDQTIDHQIRIDTVVNWYKLPANRRPHFSTLYFDEVDSAGHDYGQDSPQLMAAINQVDTTLAKLMAQLNALDIKVNVVIVSDHGMATVPKQNYEHLPLWLKQQFMVKGGGPLVHIYQKKSQKISLSQTVSALNRQAKHYRCYQYQDLPPKLNINKSHRMGDISCLPNKKWAIGFNGHKPIGDHGWDQYNDPDLSGIFYASGPNFKQNYQLETTDNIHVMPLLAHILGLKLPSNIDGKLKPMQALLH